ncbi:hypothetical protein GCM10011316_29860 [Roseibium aquae]|uniref:Uncharacterized protein n=1 Tax=Roseibium aquae TaxID=1323746 RepID=A0A916TLA6_9HYPH|nr:hypothetical protein GCM10011316_29860 [Roseibium aquae]
MRIKAGLIEANHDGTGNARQTLRLYSARHVGKRLARWRGLRCRRTKAKPRNEHREQKGKTTHHHNSMPQA